MIWIAVLVAAVGCFAITLAGLSLPASVLERPEVQRVAAFLPIAMLASGDGGRLAVDVHLLAGVGAGLVALVLRASFLVVIVAAVITTAVLRGVT